MDAALKAADVSVATFFAPPSETNFGGGYLTGSQAACSAACDAFQQAVLDVAALPIDI
jgi:ethanolamine utilization protein EutL